MSNYDGEIRESSRAVEYMEIVRTARDLPDATRAIVMLAMMPMPCERRVLGAGWEPCAAPGVRSGVPYRTADYAMAILLALTSADGVRVKLSGSGMVDEQPPITHSVRQTILERAPIAVDVDGTQWCWSVHREAHGDSTGSCDMKIGTLRRMYEA